MRVGDPEWRQRTAQYIRDVRRAIGRDFARDVVLPSVRKTLALHYGDECIHAIPKGRAETDAQ